MLFIHSYNLKRTLVDSELTVQELKQLYAMEYRNKDFSRAEEIQLELQRRITYE